MAGFIKASSSTLKRLEEKVNFLEVFNVPVNFSTGCIGEGSFAHVYKFTLRNKPAAVKRFKQSISMKQLLKAVEVLYKLKHDNIVRLRGYSTRPGALLFELCEVSFDGTVIHNLKELVTIFNDNDYFCFKERLDYGTQIAKGLQYLHDQEIVHRDIKPTNILVTGTIDKIIVKVTDFSHISEMKDTCRSIMTTNPLKGTTYTYLPPEIVLGESSLLTFSSDIYSFGITFFEMLSNLNSPWEKVLNVFNDELLKNTLRKGLRPGLEILTSLYPDDKLEIILHTIESCWNDTIGNRPNMTNVVRLLNNSIDVGENRQEGEKCKREKTRQTRQHNKKITFDDEAKEWVLKDVDKSFFEKLYINDTIGWGVFAKAKILKGSFLLEYKGELVSEEEGFSREKVYEKDNKGNYIYFFKHKGTSYCLDATDNNNLGKFVNDSSNPNCVMKVVSMNDKPHLCLQALCNIDGGTELRYNYGVRNLWWRKKKEFNFPLKANQICDKIINCIIDFTLQQRTKRDGKAVKISLDFEDSSSDEMIGIQQSISKVIEENYELSGMQESVTDVLESDDTNKIFFKQKSMCTNQKTAVANEVSDIIESATNIPNNVDKNKMSGKQKTAVTKKSVEEYMCNYVENAELTVIQDSVSCVIKTFDMPKATGQNNLINPSNECVINDSDDVISKIAPNISEQASFSKEHTIKDDTVISDISEVIPEQVDPINDSGFQLDADMIIENSDDAMNGSSVDTEAHVEKRKKRKKKPKRFCIFCQKRQTYLRRHIRTKHKNVPEVKEALGMKGKEQDEAFKTFRRKGICEVNRVEACKVKPVYERERAPKIDKTTEPVFCSHCLMFCNRKYWFHHKKNCQKHSCKTVIPIPANLLEANDETEVSEEFRNDVLSVFRNDDIGRLCQKDMTILKIGSVLYNKVKRKAGKLSQVKKSVRTDMRRLAHLFIIFKEIPRVKLENGTAIDMFDRSNFDALTESINKYSTGEDAELKPGLKQNLFYLLKRSAKIMKGFYLAQKKDDRSEEIEKFVSVLEMMEDYVFGDAVYQLNRNRNIKLRKPSELPLEKDVEKFQVYVMDRMKALLDPMHLFDSSSFVELRDCACSRLTLLNARRGGEAARLTLREFQEAVNDSWIDDQRLDDLDDLEKRLVNDLKITYMTGKGNNHLVPVLIPPDTMQALKKLSDISVRNVCGVAPENQYLFASTKQSEEHASGWHCIYNVMTKVELEKPENFKATNNRHRVATLFSALNLSAQERNLFFKHMGHSEAVNINSYQAPPAIMEVTTVGKNLLNLDKVIATSTNEPIRAPKFSQKIEQPKHTKQVKPVTRERTSKSDVVETACLVKPYGLRKRDSKKLLGIEKEYERDSGEDDEESDGNYRPLSDHSSTEDEEVVRPKSSSEVEKDLPMKSFRWTPEVIKNFNKRFGDYVTRAAVKPMPSKDEMIEFLRENRAPVDKYLVVRTRINNERAKMGARREQNLKHLKLI